MNVSFGGLACLGALALFGCGGTSANPDGGGSAGSAAGGNKGRGGSGTAGSMGGSTGTGTAGAGGSAAGTFGTGGSGTGGSGTGGSGTGGGGVDCLNTQPCGGNVIGTWQYTADCLDVAALQAGLQQTFCAQAVVTSATATRSGTLNFGIDGTYSVTTAATAFVSYTFPFSCVSSSAASCAAYGNLVQQAPTLLFNCNGTTFCNCVESLTQNATDNGTFQTVGTNLTVTSALDGSTTSKPFCVQGSTLHLITTDPNAATGVGEDVVAQRQ